MASRSQTRQTASESRRGSSRTQQDSRSQTRKSQKQTQSAEFDTDKFTKNMLKFILNNSISKLPIKRSDLVSECAEGNQKAFQQVFEEGRLLLNELFGIDIIEVTDQKSVKTFITISNIPAVSLTDLNCEGGKSVLLFLILSYIFMKGHPIEEESIFQYLNKLKINVNEEHPYFGGNLKKLITETFVKQLYLKREKVQSVISTEGEFIFSWGFRSHHEYPKKLVLNEVAKILCRPAICFVKQHLEVTGENADDEDAKME